MKNKMRFLVAAFLVAITNVLSFADGGRLVDVNVRATGISGIDNMFKALSDFLNGGAIKLILFALLCGIVILAIKDHKKGGDHKNSFILWGVCVAILLSFSTIWTVLGGGST